MASDKGKPALTERRNMKAVARLLLAVHAGGQELSRVCTALGLDYTVSQGTTTVYSADPEAAAFMTLLNTQILSFLQTNAATITLAADLGDNIQ
jgi:hypothetical protein